MLLMIDNYDSFTYNIVHYLRELGESVELVKNDAVTLDDIGAMAPERIVISPGPGRPEQAGISMAVIQRFASHLPILGVCLGHQCIAAALGGQICRAANVMHGKTSRVFHDGKGLFDGMALPVVATRYHSLVVDAATLPTGLRVNAWTEAENGERAEVMALSHERWPLFGVQFHPESILSESGHRLLENFLRFSPRATNNSNDSGF